MLYCLLRLLAAGLRHVTASWGDCSEGPGQVPLAELPDPAGYCQRCGKGGDEVQTELCGDCGRFAYCSQECRVKDGAAHATACLAG